ncbi:DUF6496 domain-containing protein [Paraburkholderia bryophila]|uniref:DNA-binding protein n=1 Tax=Paraburkholderia bryophila TaxID=420952 RepID=A0A329CLN2_9BURK|nr:DUF6496 domain-containing protein [Paraburkholderia bryophila]RAS35300.1 hypothetical protein BX591_10519 [Paraburkholderia bryophila]
MPGQKTLKRAAADKRAGKASSTQAGEFVKEQIDRVRAGKHGVRSARQAIAIGLSEARRAGVAVKSPKKGTASEATRKKAATDNAAGQHRSSAKKSAKKSAESTAKRSRASTNALKREGSTGASRTALSKQTRSAAAKQPAASRSAAAKKAAATKGAAGRSTAAKKAAHTRASRAHH